MTNEIPLQVAKDYIYSIDLSGIVEKLVYREGWLQSDAVATCKLYRNFCKCSISRGACHPAA